MDLDWTNSPGNRRKLTTRGCSLEEIRTEQRLLILRGEFENIGGQRRGVKMKNGKLITAIAVLFVLVGQRPSVVYSQSTNDRLSPQLQQSLTPDEEFTMAFTAARAQRYLASARGYIVQKNIPGAERELGRALTLIDEMKSQLPGAKVQELISTARTHLTYEDPKKVIQDLDSIVASAAEIRQPSVAKAVTQHLDRARALMEKGDKKADQELAAAADVLMDMRVARPLALIEKQVLAAEGELATRQPKDADRSLQTAEDGLRVIAVQVDTPVFQTKMSLWRASVNYAAGGWEAAKADLERASALSDQALKSATAESRTEIQDLNNDIGALLRQSTQSGKNLGNSINEVRERSDSLVERALDYNITMWERFQATHRGSPELIEAKLHVAYAEIYEFTTGDKQKADMELGKAESYVRKASPQISEKAKPILEGIDKQLIVAKTQVGSNGPGQRERYEVIRSELTRLIH